MSRHRSFMTYYYISLVGINILYFWTLLINEYIKYKNLLKHKQGKAFLYDYAHGLTFINLKTSLHLHLNKNLRYLWYSWYFFDNLKRLQSYFTVRKLKGVKTMFSVSLGVILLVEIPNYQLRKNSIHIRMQITSRTWSLTQN